MAEWLKGVVVGSRPNPLFHIGYWQNPICLDSMDSAGRTADDHAGVPPGLRLLQSVLGVQGVPSLQQTPRALLTSHLGWRLITFRPGSLAWDI